MENKERKNDIPMYQVIINDIKEKIKNNNYDKLQPICTEKTLCQEYNVSRITAKRAIDELEWEGILYRKRGVGSFVMEENLSEDFDKVYKGKTKTVALVIPFNLTTEGNFKSLQSSIMELQKKDIIYSLYICPEGYEEEKEVIKNLSDDPSIYGIVYYPTCSKIPVEYLDKFVSRGAPVIILDKTIPYERFNTITCDNVNGGYLLGQHLVSFGHKDIAFISAFEKGEVSSVDERYEGLCKYLKQSGIKEAEYVKLELGYDNTFNFPVIRHNLLLLQSKGVTAAVCENDKVALDFYFGCMQSNIEVPQQISITGFDNVSFATTAGAQITTVDQNFDQMGQYISNILLKKYDKPIHVKVPVTFVPRTSTGIVK